MVKVFLFGGPYNGEIMQVSYGEYIYLPSPYVQKDYSVMSENIPLDMLQKQELYQKHEMIFRRAGWNTERSSGFQQMEDLNVYFHSSIPKDVISSLEKIVFMAINAKWESKINGY